MKYVLLLPMLLCLNAYAGIASYQDLSTAIQNGARFNVVTNFANCLNQPVTPVITTFSTSRFTIVPPAQNKPETISTTDLAFNNADGKPVYMAVQYVFHLDNSVVITTTEYDPKTWRTLGKAQSVTCALNTGVNISAY